MLMTFENKTSSVAERYENERGELHREDGPALVWDSGCKWYYKNGVRWKIEGDRYNFYYDKDNEYHREDGPAIEYNDGFKVWSLNGVKVPQYLAETPTEKLDLQFFKKIMGQRDKSRFRHRLSLANNLQIELG